MSSLSVVRGDDFNAVFTVSDNGGAVNLTGFTVSAVASWPAGSVTATVTTIDLVAGRVRVSLQEAQTALLPLGRVAEMKFRWVSAGGDSQSIRVGLEVSA